MRPKHQITLSASVVREAKIKLDDRLTVTYLNGSIIITPKLDAQAQDIMSFAGIGRGLWDSTPQAVEATLTDMKHAWER